MAKSKRQTQFDTVTGSLGKALVALKDLAETASTDPYLTDAQAFVTQAGVCVEKQIVVEFGAADLPEAKPSAAKKGK